MSQLEQCILETFVIQRDGACRNFHRNVTYFEGSCHV